MNQKDYIEQGEKYILKTYNRYPVVLEKAEGVYLYDAEGKRYLDFGAGIAVFALGYGNKAYNDALKDQIDKLIHTSNLFYNIPAVEAAKKIVEASKMKKVFFTNSGTEAIEGALKVPWISLSTEEARERCLLRGTPIIRMDLFQRNFVLSLQNSMIWKT